MPSSTPKGRRQGRTDRGSEISQQSWGKKNKIEIISPN